MSDLDLTEAHIAALEVADREAPGIIRATVIYDIADAAIAKIERQVREHIAAAEVAAEREARWRNLIAVRVNRGSEANPDWVVYHPSDVELVYPAGEWP